MKIKFASLAPAVFAFFSSALAYSADLTVANRYAVPLVEISGLSIAGDSLFLASDRDFNLMALPLVGDDIGGMRASESKSVKISMPAGSSGSSQWEAVAVNNGAGYFVLNENESKIFHFDTQGRAVKTYTLEGWEGRRNPKKGFEAMMLLKSSHFLIALESEPPTLIEYGPSGDSPQGLKASDGDIAAPSDTFEAPSDTKLVPLAAWSWKTDPGSCQFSDLARAADGGILILMKVCMKVGHVAELKVGSDTFKTTETWGIPAEIDHPEGMQALGDKGLLLSRDLQDVETNLYWLTFPGK